MKTIFSITKILLIVFFTAPIFTFAQSGSLDSSFGTNGIVTTDGITNNNPQFLAIQSDGKIVEAVTNTIGTKNDFGLVRYNTDGSLDNAFGTNGKVITPIGIAADLAFSVAIQNDGKIVLAGYSFDLFKSDFALIRYNYDGSLDNTFGTNGIVTTTIRTGVGIYDGAHAVVLQSDGKIVAAGSSNDGTNSVLALVRYNTNGSLDNTFGINGIVTTTSIGTHSGVVDSLVIQNNGEIIAAGLITDSNNRDFLTIIRYNPNGSLDNTFGTNGIVTTSINSTSNDRAFSVALQSDEKIVAAGSSFNGTNSVFALLRYNTNGSLDNTFDNDGIVTTAIGTDCTSYSLAIQSDGKIVVAGNSKNGANYDFALTRYNTNGNLDTVFGTNGIVNTGIGTSFNFLTGLAIQTDGKIVIAGTSNNGISLVRYNNTINGLNTIDNQMTDFKIYPNPLSTQATLQTNLFLKDATLTLYNSEGKKVKEIKNIVGQTMTISRDNLASGLYFFQLTEDNKIIEENKLVISN